MMLWLAALAVAQSTAPTAKVLAVCGASVGKSYYVEPKVTGWIDDGITGGAITLIIDSNGKPDVIERDAMRRSQFASGNGRVVAPLIAEEKGSYIFVVLNNELNEVLTYQVTTAASGQRTLLWTDSKARKTTAGITKVAAFVAPCEAVQR